MSNDHFENSETLSLINVSRPSTTTDYVLHGTVDSIYTLFKLGLQHQLAKTKSIKIYYQLDDSSEQISKAEALIVQNFMNVWNDFATVLAEAQSNALEIHNNQEITQIESKANTIPCGLSKLSEVIYIDTTYVLPDSNWGTPNRFELYRGIITAIAASSEGLVHGRSLAICPPDSELSLNQTYTLNTLSKLLLGINATVIPSPINVMNPFEHLLKNYADLTGIEEFTKTINEFPRRILAVRNGLLLADDYPELKAKTFLKSKAKRK